MRQPSRSVLLLKSAILPYAAYTVALFTSAVTTFGAAGIPTAIVVLSIWGFIFLSRWRPDSLAHFIVAGVILLILIALLLPAVQQAREASPRATCKSHLRQIGLALYNYHDAYGSFPPAWTTDADGRPLLSWRVLLLPYLDQLSLYEEFDLTEPWDGPHNRELLRRIPSPYACPSSVSDEEGGETATSYVAVMEKGPRGQVHPPAAFPISETAHRNPCSSSNATRTFPGPNRATCRWMKPSHCWPPPSRSQRVGIAVRHFFRTTSTAATSSSPMAACSTPAIRSMSESGGGCSQSPVTMLIPTGTWPPAHPSPKPAGFGSATASG